ncbi:MAG: CPBP family intramembrane metalloprotease [Anaerolineae bacterium]|nr:CPBP family intramembrane metalloprotease [Anaerolineae bacterium]
MDSLLQARKTKSYNIRREIITFLVILAVLSVVFNTLIITGGGLMAQNGLYALGLMFSPAFAALLVRFIYARNLRGFGWKWGKTRYQILGYVVPMIYVLISYSLILLLGLGKLNTEITNKLNIVDILQFATLNVMINCVIVVGEEIGWRGFLLPQLARIMSFTQASMIVGVVWTLCHYPILIFMNYNTNSTPVWYSLICFSVLAMGVNMAMNWLRLKSGSLWTVIIFHAAHNEFIQELDPMIIDTGLTQYFISEFGVMLALAGVIVGWVFWRRRNELLATGNDTEL